MGRKPCCDKAHTNRGAWTKEEDDRLIEYIRMNGHGSWRSLPKAAGAYAQNFSFFFLLLFFCSLGYQTVDFDLGFGFFLSDRITPMRQELSASVDKLPSA